MSPTRSKADIQFFRIRDLWPLCLLVLVYTVDFHLDIRQRDTFSWMDPWQYYLYGLSTFRGDIDATGLTLPSVFPFLFAPFFQMSQSIPTALWANGVSAILLVLIVHVLAKQLGLNSPTVLIAAVVLSCPLLLGLSRELYSEFTLTAVVAGQFAIWLGLYEFNRRMWIVPMMLLFTFGVLLKTTYPLFFLAPFLLEAARRVSEGKFASLVGLGATFVVPVVVALLIVKVAFPQAFEYYASLGNTAFPIMPLIGPREAFSFESAVFYFGHVGITMLVCLTPFLLFPIWRAFRRADSGTALLADAQWRRDALLWLWFLGPLLILILQPVKEPRHVAPCVVPAVLLIFRGIEHVQHRQLRFGLVGALIMVASLQYAAIATRLVYCPYFMDKPVRAAEIDRAIVGSVSTAADAKRLNEQGKFLFNFAVAGFGRNEALSLVWQFHPGVVYNLDLFEHDLRALDTPLREFEDLYTYESFNTYNWRCRYPVRYESLERQTVVDQADFLIVKGADFDRLAEDYPLHRLVERVSAADGDIAILSQPFRDSEHYRVHYGRRFLQQNQNLNELELNTVYFDMAMADFYRIPFRPKALLQAFPSDYSPGQEARPIHYYSTYNVLLPSFEKAYREFLKRQKR